MWRNYFNLLNSIGSLNTGQTVTGSLSNDPYTFRCLTKEVTGNFTQIFGGINNFSTPLISGIFGYGKSGFKMFLTTSYDDYSYYINSSGSGNATLDKFKQTSDIMFQSIYPNSENQNETSNSSIYLTPPPKNY